MIFIVAALCLFLSFVENTHMLRHPLFHGLAWGPAVLFLAVDMFVFPISRPPLPGPVGFTSQLVFFPSLWGRIAGVWNNVIWIVSISIPIYSMLISYNRDKKRASQIVAVAALVLFSHHALVQSNLIIRTQVNLAIFSPFILVSICLLGYAIRKYELPELTPKTVARSILAALPDAVLLIGPDQRIRFGNPAAQRLLEYDAQRIKTLTIADLFPEGADIPPWTPPPGVSRSEVSSTNETVLITRSGNAVIVSMAVSELSDINGATNGYLFIARDMTEQKTEAAELAAHREYLETVVTTRSREIMNANESLKRSRLILRRLSERLFEAKEEESARIARELHDELGQILTGLKIDVTLLMRKLTPADERTTAENITRHIDNTIQRVQTLTKELRPPMLEKLGLVATLESLATELNRRHGIRCRTIYDNTAGEDLPAALLTASYRIVQEALDNVIRHANARQVEIRIAAENGELLIAVEDDGVGMADAVESLGILGMKERALTLGGAVHIAGNHPFGTSVRLRLPIPPLNVSPHRGKLPRPQTL